MIYIVTENQIKKYNTLEEMEQEGMLLEEQELKSIGQDYIVKLTNKDLDFVRDKYLLSRLPIERLYGRPNVMGKQKAKKSALTTILIFTCIGSIFINALLGGLLLAK